MTYDYLIGEVLALVICGVVGVVIQFMKGEYYLK